MASKLSFYNTSWNDRIATRTVENIDGDEDIIYLTGINQVHSGVEIEFAGQFTENIRVDMGASLGKWIYSDDATGTYRDSDGSDASYSYALKDLRVGDMPQASLNFGLTANPIDGATVQLSARHYRLFFSDWSPTSRAYSSDDDADRAQSWRTPPYTVFDLNASYYLPVEFGGVKPQLILNIRNLFDAVYIQDAVDNSRYNAVPFRVNDHSANAAEVYLGMPTSFNLGIKVNF